jgi:hypothetical protein
MSKESNINKDQTGLIKAIIDGMPGIIALLDSQKKIVYYNDEFKTFFNDPKPLGKVFGESVSCSGIFEKGSTKNKGILCKHCKLNNAISRALAEKKLQDKETMILSLKRSNENQIKLIQFQINHLSFNEKDYSLVFINDLTFLGDKALNYINGQSFSE